MRRLFELVQADIAPSLGVTEPGAIAFAVARARSLAAGRLENVSVELNSGIYKNAFTCGIPNSSALGCAHAAALGAIGGDWSRGLEALSGVTSVEDEEARRFVAAGHVQVTVHSISPDIHIHAVVRTAEHVAETVITGSHIHITRLALDGQILFQEPPEIRVEGVASGAAGLTLLEMLTYVDTAPEEDFYFLHEALEMDLALYRFGRAQGITPLTETLFCGEPDGTDPHALAQAYCCGAIEARVRGAAMPAMSLTGSGSHGILAMLPICAAAQASGTEELRMLRAVLLSCLVTMYIKEYSGKLSAACGCVLAGGTGTALGLTYLYGGDYETLCRALNIMATSLTGMICHGGNPGCSLKALAGVDMAFHACDMAHKGLSIGNEHSILGDTPEQTMQNMGYVSAPGMVPTEGSIMQILSGRKRSAK